MYAVFKTIFKHKTGDYKIPRMKQREKLLDIGPGNSYPFFFFLFFFLYMTLKDKQKKKNTHTHIHTRKQTRGTIPN